MATKIYNVTDLQNVNNNLTADYELANDIDCGGAEVIIGSWKTSSPGYATDSVNVGGTLYYLWCFTGSFDGKDYTISNVAIDESTAPDYRAVGLFRTLRHGGTVRNLTLSNVSIVNAFSWVGLLAGQIHDDGVATNCRVQGTVEDASYIGGLAGVITGAAEVSECSADVAIITTGNYAGGFAGYIYDSIVGECFANGSMTCNNYAGGFVGYNFGTINNSYSRVNVNGNNYIGGFVGYNGATIEIANSYSTGSVSAVLPDVGGFCAGNYGTITACFWDTQTSGQATSDGGEGKTTAEMKDIATFPTWDISETSTYRNDGYPFLSWEIGSSTTWLIYAEEAPIAGDRTIDIISLQAMRNVEMSCGGRLFIDKEGNLKYETRYSRNP